MAITKRELGEEELTELKSIAGLRYTVDRRERRLYSHDVGELPGAARRLLGDTTPAAVVQPENEEQLFAVVRWAAKHQVPLIPRGAATSGYGGVIPLYGGLVVKLVRLNRILEVNPERGTVTVEPGIVWQHLEEKLAEYGLALRLMPTSAPGSTVGGWLAQGGAGLGSFRYGWFEENVEAADVVLATGETKRLAGSELAQVSGAMGTTGIIYRVTLKVEKQAPIKVVGASFQSIGQVARAAAAVVSGGLPLWHVGFLNPVAARLKNQVPPRVHHGHPEERPTLPEAYLAFFAYQDGQDERLAQRLQEIIKSSGGSLLADELTEHEWAERFYPMKVKRLGPSIIPLEVVVPLTSLAAAVQEMENKIRQPLVLEATVVKGGQVVLLGFIPHDSRRFNFNLAYSLSLTALKIAKRHGGRAYASGLYLPQEAGAVHGERLALWRRLKAATDSRDLMNPGKLEGRTGLRTLIGLANSFSSLIRPFANAAKAPLGERWSPKGELPGNVVWYAYSCAQCGYCRTNCTLYDGRGWESASPRGKWYYLRLVAEGKEKFDQEMVNTFLMCTTCERCDFNCQLDLPVEPTWAAMRGELVNTGKFMSFPAFEMMAASLKANRNIWANFKENRDAWLPAEIRKRLPASADTAYFAGCTASFVEQDIGQAAVHLLTAAGVKFTYLGQDEACCGIPMLVAGRWDVFEEILRHNVQAMKARGVKKVITSCPACWLSWHTYYPEWAKKLGLDFPFEVYHYSEVLAEKIADGSLRLEKPVPMRVTFHDSCHIGRAGGVYEPPRRLLQAIPGLELVEMEHNRENALCCGSVLTRISEPEPTSNNLGAKRIAEAQAVKADAIVALCPCCQFQLRVAGDAAGARVPVLDLAAITAKGLGIELPDPTPYVLEMWAVFDQMIKAMQVPAMADMMVALLPDMMAAMPGYMRSMMGLVKYVPGMAAMMKVMMPKMMPMMMPSLLPKVMPAMLREMGRRISMPDFMQKQMGTLMPMVMERMLPHVLPEIARLVTPPMLDYIKNGKVPGKSMAA